MNFLKKMLPFVLLSCLFFSCGFHSLDDFKEEGEGIIRSLLQDLQELSTREELVAASNHLQQYFDRLVYLVIAAEEWMDGHPESIRNEDNPLNRELNDQLRLELNRIYKIEGGKQIIEKCQEKALHRLDAWEKQRLK